MSIFRQNPVILDGTGRQICMSPVTARSGVGRKHWGLSGDVALMAMLAEEALLRSITHKEFCSIYLSTSENENIMVLWFFLLVFFWPRRFKENMRCKESCLRVAEVASLLHSAKTESPAIKSNL